MAVPSLHNSERSGLRIAGRVTLTLQPLQFGAQGVGRLPLLLRLRQGRFFRLSLDFRTLY